MKVLFLDESGDHNLAKIDSSYPLFVLGGVIVEKDYAKSELPKEFSEFKRRPTSKAFTNVGQSVIG